ncbi:MAG TPA: ribonuclease Y [Nitrospirae bacterium]|nr:ribonuclease Y [bacterium BMS3Abin06]HDH11148.1 ribonuclease Y [Nitrospirota bacterium]HDZ02627.1 ribonuclease Y [Nitrospirota bacterium]
MNSTVYLFVVLVAGLAAGFVLSLLYNKFSTGKKLKEVEEKAERLLHDARKEARTIKKEAQLEARDASLLLKTETEKELKERRSELTQLDKRLRQREEMFDRKIDQLDKKEYHFSRKERDLNNREKGLQEKERNYEALLKKQNEVLEQISQMSVEEARTELLNRVESESRYEAARIAKRVEDEAIESADRKSKEVLSLAIQRYSSDFVGEHTISTVSLPNDEMKGRIIGREGRNIRALEAATGVEFIIDDTPETVLLSCFDPVRRETGRISLERLISDGRIHPTRIEEVVEKVRKEIESIIKEEGEKAVFDLGLHGIHPELVRLLGRLKYRTSYGQNVLQHSKEVAYLASILAGELRVDPKLAKRAGILHDIGKAVDHEVEGSHQSIGSDIARKYGENAKVVNAIRVHHGEGDPATVEASLVASADALSAARPGARKETLEDYLGRVEKLEEIATSVEGVNKSYAVQAGREVRIIVKPDEVSDEVCARISRDLAKKIEGELTYPGQIKVTVIRESRYVEYAK